MSDPEYRSVSDTAKGLAALKSVTNIPFAKQTSKLLHGHEITEQTIDPAHINGFYQSCAGFESRYLSIDQVLSATAITNFLELSSGYSFRSLDFGSRPGITYVDTDLPDIIENKKIIAAQLVNVRRENQPRFMPLNALDRNAFLQIISTFPSQPIAIINEGLLIYLNEEEKRQLCRTIHEVLTERGGFWVTADIYVRGPLNRDRAAHLPQRAQEFLSKYRIFENMFSDFDSAAKFFRECGFTVEPHLVDEVYEQLTSLEFIRRTPAIDQSILRAGLQARQTWVLRAV